MPVSFIGIDMAFSNMGLVRGYITDDLVIVPEDIKLISTESTRPGPWEPKGFKKTIRKSSIDMRRAKELVAAIQAWSFGAQIAFAEIPSGSQSAQAARALGIAVGCLASCPIPIIEVSPNEVKMAGAGHRQGTKEEIIAWAVRIAPQLPWSTRKRNGVKEVAKRNEHCADALATVHAGIKTPEFERLWALIPHATASLTHLRPPPDIAKQGPVPVGALPLARPRVRVRAR